jgi:hypothetical protein
MEAMVGWSARHCLHSLLVFHFKLLILKVVSLDGLGYVLWIATKHERIGGGGLGGG